MVYLDSSSLLKLLWPEPESDALRNHISAEDVVIVSSLTQLESQVQLRAACLAGRYRETRWRQFLAKLDEFRNTDPFRFEDLHATVFQTALRQDRSQRKSHCRTLDRLHLAAMEELNVTRLITHDANQAQAARAIGFHVLVPGGQGTP